MPGRTEVQRMVQLTMETEREADGRWIAEVPGPPGVTYGVGTCSQQCTATVKVRASSASCSGVSFAFDGRRS